MVFRQFRAEDFLQLRSLGESCLEMAREEACCALPRAGGWAVVLQLGVPGHGCRCLFLGSLSLHPVLRGRPHGWTQSCVQCSPVSRRHRVTWPAFSVRMSHPEALTFSYVSQHTEWKDWQLLPGRARPLCDPVYLVLEGVLCHIPVKASREEHMGAH